MKKVLFRCILKQWDRNNLLFQVLYIDNNIFNNVSIYKDIFKTDYFRIYRNGSFSISPNYISLKPVKNNNFHQVRVLPDNGTTKALAVSCLQEWQDSLYTPWWVKLLRKIGIPYYNVIKENDVYEIKIKKIDNDNSLQ